MFASCLILGVFEGELVLSIIAARQIHENRFLVSDNELLRSGGPTLRGEKHKIIVIMVYDDRNLTIRIQTLEPRILLTALRKGYALEGIFQPICFLQLF